MAVTSDGTVRGTFDLNVGPAVRGVREYKREAAAADVMTQQLGGTMDRTFGREKAAQINTVTDATGSLGSQTARTRTLVREEWAGMRRDVAREANMMIASIRGVKRHMTELGAMRASPVIDLDGIAEALAQLELLDRRLSAMGRQRVTPRVAIGGALASAASHGGGRSGGGFVTGGRSGFGGGGGSNGVKSIGFGPINTGSRLGLALAGGALPAVQALGGAAVGLGGSLMGAGLGAGAVGLSSGGALAAGVASVVAIAKPAQTILKNATKAQQTYTKAVQDYGVKSKQAAVAKREMDQAFGDERGLRRATRSITGFTGDWKRLTAPGRASYYGLLGDITQRGQQVAPNLAGFANRSMAAVRQSGSQFANFATNRENLGTMDRATSQFARELPTVERTLENVALTMGRLYRASEPFFHEANDWVEKWTGGLAESTRDIQGTRDHMRDLIDSAKKWRDLSGATFDLLKDIGHMGRPSGDSLVVDLTRTMDRWDAWVNSNPTQVKGFFRDTADSVRGMADALKGVVGWLNKMATLLRPLLDRFTELVTLASQLGLVGAPGSFLALRGAFMGGRGSWRGGGGTGGAVGAGMPLIVPGAPGVGRPMVAGAVAGAAASAIPMGAGYEYERRQRLIGRRVAAGMPPTRGAVGYGAPLVGGWLGSRTPGALSRMGAGVGSRALGMGARGLQVAGGALRGAGRAFWPIAAGLSALDFASFDGSFAERGQAALSSASFGIIPRPLTGDQKIDAGVQGANSLMDTLTRNTPNPRKQLAALREPYRALNANRGAEFFQARGVNVQGKEGVDALRKALGDEIRSRERLVKQMDKEKDARRDENARLGARRYAGGLPGAFGTYRHAGDDRGTAFTKTLDQVQDKLKKTKDAGVETLGEGSLAWARAMAKGNPAMKKQVEDLTDHIRDRFQRMGKFVKIVNGNILTGSKSEWRGIRDALTGSTETARQKTSDDFTAIQQQAVGSLRTMGFTPAQARSLVQGLENGGAEGRSASRVMSGHTKAGDMGFGTSDASQRARGGTVPGTGLTDTVRMGGAMVAPGETWIANRHTMKDLSMATRSMFGVTAEQMIRGETRRHSQRFATGGLAPAEGALVGRLGRMGFHPTSTTGGTHAPNSYHYRGMAADYGNSANNLPKLWSVLYPQRRRFAELFGPSSLRPTPTMMHNGQGFSDPGLQAEHEDHIHVALTGGKPGRLGRVAGGGAYGRVHLHGPGMRQPGVPGALRGRAGDMYAAGLQRKINARLGAGAGGGFNPGGGVMSFRQVARLAESVGLPGVTFAQIAKGESGFNPRAVGHDPGGTQGLGLWQITTGYNDDVIERFGGRSAMFNPRTNALAARAVYRRAGIGAWYGTRYMTDPNAHFNGRMARGGSMGMAWGGGFKNGGSMVTNGPTAFVAGEGHRRRERVTVTPANRPAGAGDGVTVRFEAGSVVVKIEGAVHDGNMDAIAEKVGKRVVGKVIEALDHGLGTVGD